MSRQAVRPRDAASLILLRETARGPEVLMGRRHARAAFIPDAYVFPGGRVDAADSRARPATQLRAHVAREVAAAASAARARAFAMAAVRETFEETGLLLGRAGAVGGVQSPSWQAIAALGQAPDLARLDYLGRAITPAGSPIRFHARFFMADAAHARGALGGSGELLDLHWVALDETDRLAIVDVTEFMLDEVRRRRAAGPADRTERPLFSYRHGQARARYGAGAGRPVSPVADKWRPRPIRPRR